MMLPLNPAEMHLANARQDKIEDITDDDVPSTSGRQLTEVIFTKSSLYLICICRIILIAYFNSLSSTMVNPPCLLMNLYLTGKMRGQSYLDKEFQNLICHSLQGLDLYHLG